MTEATNLGMAAIVAFLALKELGGLVKWMSNRNNHENSSGKVVGEVRAYFDHDRLERSVEQLTKELQAMPARMSKTIANEVKGSFPRNCPFVNKDDK
ncbi:MAG: hypothetical protein GF355_09565 [Candidatus Eisenbacteria bacterium]|nr:hypothetical protein [Candidatus Eisenbacteria bacterium]